MIPLLQRFWARLNVTPQTFMLYWVFNAVLCTGNHYFFNKDGMVPVAHFVYPWQSIHVGLYIAVQSMLVRGRSFWYQMMFAVATTSVLELPAYATGTSQIEPGNFLERLFGPANFTLAITLSLSFLIPLNNAVVPMLERLFFGKASEAKPSVTPSVQ